MATLNTAWNITTGALQADQAALNIVANNTANAATPGYTRETANWQQNDPVTISGVSYGSGAQVTGAASQRDRVLEQRLQQQTQDTSASTARLSALQGIETVFNSAASTSTSGSSGGIGSALNGLFNSLSQLEASPNDNTLRQQVLSNANSLAQSFTDASASLSQQQDALDQQASTTASQINALTHSIAALNLQISSTSPNGDAGTLEDQRQQDLSQLSQLVGIHQIQTESNGLTVTTCSGVVLVSEGQASTLTTGLVNGTTHFFSGPQDITASLTSGGGQLGGMLMARDQDIPQISSALDQLAYSLATQMNALNNAGTDVAGDNGGAGNIFAPPAQVAGSASSMSVVMTDPNHLAAASLGKGVGDNTNVTAMANLANSGIVAGQTPSGYYSNFVSTLGSLTSEVQTENTAQQASLTQLQNQRNALSSVDLNEEASAMSDLERSYEAASKVFAILNSVMASALNLGTQTTVS